MSTQQETLVYDHLFSVVGRAEGSMKRVTDNFGNSQPTLDLYHSAGRVEVQAGESIEEKLMYDYQDIEWMDGRQKVNTDDKDMITKAVFPWRFALAPINIAETDRLKAQGSDEAQIEFVESKIMGARKGLRTGLNTAMNGAQAGKSILGVQDLIRDSVATGTLGGIDLSSAANAWYRNTATTTGITFLNQTTTGIFDGWSNIGTAYETASDVNEEVTHIRMGSALYAKALSSLEGSGYTQFVNNHNGGIGRGGQQGVGNSNRSFRNAVVYKDRATPAAHIYLENINAMKLKIMRSANFAKTAFVKTDANGILGMIAYYLVGCQYVNINPRRTHVLTNVS